MEAVFEGEKKKSLLLNLASTWEVGKELLSSISRYKPIPSTKNK